MSQSKTANYKQEVRDQYEDFPYPKRNPEDEKKRLVSVFPDFLDVVSHYGFEGKQIYQKGFRALVAGGGTGDSVIMLAEQLKDTDGEVVYVDISQSSMAIAKARAEVRGLTNITWHHGSLLDLAQMGIGTFDYINCSGVLHHLESPEEGLNSLKSVLKDDGVIMLMVYGKYGRTSIYQMQELMRHVNQGKNKAKQRIDNTKEILKVIPETNWFSKTKDSFKADVETYGDAGIYDLFLHSQDRAYSVPELYDFVESCDLHLVDFITSMRNGKLYYNPEFALKGERLKGCLEGLSKREKQTVAELFWGNFAKHIIYVTKKEVTVPEPSNEKLIPYFGMDFYGDGIYEAVYQHFKQSNSETETLKHDLTGNQVHVKRTKHINLLLKYIDGERSIADIYQCVEKDKELTAKVTKKELRDEFASLYKALNFFDWMMLKA